MSFIQIAFCITAPLLVLLGFSGNRPAKYFSTNLLSVTNLLLIGYSVFLIRQMVGFYELSKQLGIEQPKEIPPVDAYTVRFLCIIVLPFFTLIRPVRKSWLFTVVMLVLLYWNSPVYTWNSFDLFTKTAVYLCLLCSAYALLWLIKQLPYQSRV